MSTPSPRLRGRAGVRVLFFADFFRYATVRSTQIAKALNCDMNLTNTKHRLVVDDADLRGSSFRNANLSGSTLENVNLSGARISDANLSGTEITDANIQGLRINGVSIEDAIAALNRRA